MWCIFILLFIPIFSLIIYFVYIIFGEDYLGSIVYAGVKLVVSFYWNVPWIVILSYVLLSSFGIMVVSIKSFLTVSMVVGNFMNIFLFGIIAVFIIYIVYAICFGFTLSCLFFIYFLSSSSAFLYLFMVLEGFSTVFQTLTLSNRLSINMLCGSLLTSLLSLFTNTMLVNYVLLNSVFILCVLLVIFLFEILNTFIQFFIFSVLSFEYMMIVL